ncbi:hypothetical protein [Demequina soli]|uniref:hypothetical protein n=1 Tax=Demequina soli TaxID=1638987 RepID=UPI0007815067|nr:hypothetical protein [Demequina soli]
MSAELRDAFEEEAAHASAGEVDGIRERAVVRVRRRRRLGAGAYALAGLALAGLAAATIVHADAGDPARVAASSTHAAPVARTAHPTVLHSQDLVGTGVPRERDQYPGFIAQPAIVCTGPARTDALAPCPAVWVGDRALLRIDPGRSTVTAYRAGGHARVAIDWTATNVGTTALALEADDAVAALLTHPTRNAGTERIVAHGTYRGGSLWVADDSRLARHVDALSRTVVAAGDTVSGTAVFDADQPVAGAPPDAVWDTVTAAARATLTLEIGVAPAGSSPGYALMLETSMSLSIPPLGVSADTLVPSWSPRTRGEAAPTDAQAALLCDVPRGMRSSAYENYHVPLRAEQVACEPGWVAGPVVVDDGTLRVIPGTPEPSVEWSARNATGRTLLVARTALMLEPRPAGVRRTGDTLSLLGSVVVTPSSAWLRDGRRLAWLSNVTFDMSVAGGTRLAGQDALYPGLLSSGQIVDVDAVAAALASRGAATVVTAVPFLADRSRVLILETPLVLPSGPGASPGASP